MLWPTISKSDRSPWFNLLHFTYIYFRQKVALVCKIGNEELKYHFTCAIPIIVTENACGCIHAHYTHAFLVRIIVIQFFNQYFINIHEDTEASCKLSN